MSTRTNVRTAARMSDCKMNAYVKLLADAKELPGAYRAMGTRETSYRDTRTGTSVTGWVICQFAHKRIDDGPEWWSNDFNLFVDTQGDLWELHLGEEYSRYESPQHTSSVGLRRVDGEQLRTWHVNGWDFAKMKRSVEAMV